MYGTTHLQGNEYTRATREQIVRNSRVLAKLLACEYLPESRENHKLVTW